MDRDLQTAYERILMNLVARSLQEQTPARPVRSVREPSANSSPLNDFLTNVSVDLIPERRDALTEPTLTPRRGLNAEQPISGVMGKRKYNVGKRARRQGYWIFTITEVIDQPNNAETCDRSRWFLVKRRDAATLTDILERWLTLIHGQDRIRSVEKHDTSFHCQSF